MGDAQKRGKPEMPSSCREIHSICTDRRDPGPAAGLQVSPTSDTCQSVAILMNRRHCIISRDQFVRRVMPKKTARYVQRPSWMLVMLWRNAVEFRITDVFP